MGEHLACLGYNRHAYEILTKRTEGKRSPGRLGVDGKIILKRIL
jgi:hypothetical protein